MNDKNNEFFEHFGQPEVFESDERESCFDRLTDIEEFLRENPQDSEKIYVAFGLEMPGRDEASFYFLARDSKWPQDEQQYYEVGLTYVSYDDMSIDTTVFTIGKNDGLIAKTNELVKVSGRGARLPSFTFGVKPDDQTAEYKEMSEFEQDSLFQIEDDISRPDDDDIRLLSAALQKIENNLVFRG